MQQQQQHQQQQLLKRKRVPLPSAMLGGHTAAEVVAVTDHLLQPTGQGAGRLLYCIHWRAAAGAEGDSWEPLKHLRQTASSCCGSTMQRMV
uniref:Chromo domain-containing protein n=1 Tax=Tetradesmus obliquus TaxID=3088 RepID=A0A383VZE0_TETOB